MVFINEKLLFGVNLLRCIWMTLDRKLRHIAELEKRDPCQKSL